MGSSSVKKIEKLTFPRKSGAEIVVEVEGVLDGEALGHPHLLELDDRTFLTDRDDSSLLSEAARVVLEKADPKFGKRLLKIRKT